MKVPLAFIPPASIIYEGQALSVGAKKYGPYNWRELPIQAMTYIAANQRHILAYLDGEDIDPECGVPHIGLAKACLGILADATELRNLIDNRPKKGRAGSLLRELAANGNE